MKKIGLFIICLCFMPMVTFANIVCNDGTISPSCMDCHKGCCSRHGGCSNSSSNVGGNTKSNTSESKQNKVIKEEKQDIKEEVKEEIIIENEEISKIDKAVTEEPIEEEITSSNEELETKIITNIEPETIILPSDDEIIEENDNDGNLISGIASLGVLGTAGYLVYKKVKKES